jgi:hypothetical protein
LYSSLFQADIKTGVKIETSQSRIFPYWKKLCKAMFLVFAINFLTSFALNFELITCLRLSFFFLLVYLVTVEKQRETTAIFYLEQSIKVGLLVAYSAFSWTLFLSFDSVIFRLCLILSSPAIVFLIRAVRFDVIPVSHKSWARRTSVDLYLITLMSVFWILFIWGWKSLLFAAIALTCVVVLNNRLFTRFAMKRLLIQGISTLVLIIGATLSRFAVQPYSSDFLLSHDQIFRGSMATGLTRWGVNNSYFGFGHKMPYHWLAESIAGLMARVGSTSEIESVTRLAPYFGMLLFVITCMLLLFCLGASLPGSVLVVVFTAAFINHLDPASIGTLWGAAFFMVTLLYVLTGMSPEHVKRSATLVAILTGLTILCQSVLGFVLAISLIGLFTIRIFTQRNNKPLYLISIITLFLVSIVLHLLFFSASSILENQEVVNLNNWLRFPGVPIELGRSVYSVKNAVHLNSLFFIFYLSAIFGIVLFNVFRPDIFGTVSRLFAFQFGVGFLLLNIISLGEFTGKLLAPIGLLGTFLGFFALLYYLENHLRNQRTMLFLFLVVIPSIALQNSDVHSLIVDTGEGLLFLFLIALAFLAVALGINRSRPSQTNRSTQGVGLVLMVLGSTFFVLHNVDPWQASRVFQDRTSRLSMFDSIETRDCLQFLKDETPETSVVATSLWRIPGGSDEKYFLTSLMSQRLVLIDGPVYSDLLNWQSVEYFENLKNIHTSFANSLDRPSHNQLVYLGATYFLLDTRLENPDRTWSNLLGKGVVFGNEDCSVIKL